MVIKLSIYKSDILSLFELKMSTGQKTQEIFRITKSENKNKVIYEAIIEEANPKHILNIHAYWLRDATDGHVEELSWIDRTLAYGVRIDEQKDDEITFHVVSLPKYKVRVTNVDGVWKGIVDMEGIPAYIKTIYVDVTTVILIKPTIHSITVTGEAVDDGREVQKVIK